MNEARMKSLIKEHEGKRLAVYDDANGEPIVPGSVVKGHPTIGFGRALDVRGISEHEAQSLFDRDFREAIQDAQRHFLWFPELEEPRRFVIISMIFQMGAQGVMGFRRMCAAIEKRDFQEAADQMFSSLWATQTPKRARELSEIMRSGRYSV